MRSELCKLAVLIFLLWGQSVSQEIKIEWGNIPKEDLQMKSFPQDTNASALILYESGNSYINMFRYKNIYEYTGRIKIFSAEGYKYATHSIRYYKDLERIDNLEGATYYIDEKGELIKNELKEEDIQEKNLSGKRFERWFTLPLLRPGCVIEFKYTIISDYSGFRDWTYQTNQPVRWSEYQIEFPAISFNYSYIAVHQGTIPFVIKKNETIQKAVRGQYITFGRMRWAVKDAPALREEPYMTTIDDYAQRTYIFRTEIHDASNYAAQAREEWKSFVNGLLDSDSFGEKIDDTRQIRKIASEVTAGFSSSLEKIKALNKWVASNIRWNGNYSYEAWRDQDDVIEKKEGNVADINFILLSLVKAAGIDCEPIVASTRSNGKFINDYPIPYNPNYVIGRVKVDSEYYYLDATDPQRPFELLPTCILNVRGLVIRKDSIEWITITSPKISGTGSTITLKIGEDGTCSGMLEDTYREYAAFFERKKLKSKTDEEIGKDNFNTEKLGISIDSILVENKDSIDLPLTIKAWISSTSFAQQSGDIIYINPHILHRLDENPFKSAKREFPVDYSYGGDETITTNIVIPDGYEIKESIGNRTLSVGANYLRYLQKMEAGDNAVRLINKLEIRKTQLGPEFYQRLREMYGQMVAIESQQLVLERKQPVTTPEAKSKKKGKK
jgi:transglutaminase-like putative cysteine protease